MRASDASDDLRVILCLAFDRRSPVSELDALKSKFTQSPSTVSWLELSGTYDMIVEVSLPDISAYQGFMNAIAGQLSRLVARYEANFVCKHHVAHGSGFEQVVWVPCHEGHRRLDCSKIDWIEAEGDYMRVFSGGTSWLIHSTLKEMMKRLNADQFVPLHRSAIVRLGFVERLIHEGRRWLARFEDGTEQPIARSHIGQVLNAIRYHSSKVQPHSSTAAPVIENSVFG